MIIVTGRVAMEKGGVEKLREAMAAMIAASRAEPGCLEYAYGPDFSDSDSFLVLEKWESRKALDAHFETPHLRAWRAALSDAGLVSREIVAVEEKDASSV